MEQPTTSPNTTANTSTATSEHKVVAKAISVSKECKVGDTTIIALKASSMELRAGEMLLIIWSVAVVTHDRKLRPFADRIIYVLDGAISDKPVEEEMPLSNKL